MEKTCSTLSVIILLFITGCGTTKRTISKSTQTEVASVYSKLEKSKHITVNNSISDTIFLPLNSGNKQVDSIVTRKLQHFKTSKKSGVNSYGIRYDTKANGFEITSRVGATKNIQEKRQDSIVNKKIIETRKEIKDTKIRHRIPLWIWVLLVVLIGIVYVAAKLKLL